MRVGLDVTPLLGSRTGVGRYVEALVSSLAALPSAPELRLVGFSWRGLNALPAAVPPGMAALAGRRRAPARLLRELWALFDFPPVEWLSGPLDVFHGTNFVLPPRRRAAGVVTVHDLTFHTHPEWVSADSARYRRLVPRALAAAGAVCAPSAAVAEQLAQTYRVDPARLVVTPLGVDRTWREAKPPEPRWLAAHRLPERYVIFVGALEPRKNLDTLISAYAELVGGDPAAPPLVLAGPAGWGPGPALDLLPAGKLVRVGYLPREALAALVAGATCLAFPSRNEGFGLPPLEALACGTPVVASDLPVLHEVLGPHARFVAAADRDALAAALELTMRDDGPTPRAARRRHAAAWTWERCASATLGAYQLAAAGA